MGNDRTASWIKIMKRINDWVLVLPMIALVAMMFIDSANVFTIWLFGFNVTPSQKETIEELMIIVVYVALAAVLLGPGHIKTAMIRNKLGQFGGLVADLIASIATVGLGVFATWMTTRAAVQVLARGTSKMGDMVIPLAPFFFIIAASLAMFTAAALLVAIKNIVLIRESKVQARGAFENNDMLQWKSDS